MAILFAFGVTYIEKKVESVLEVLLASIASARGRLLSREMHRRLTTEQRFIKVKSITRSRSVNGLAAKYFLPGFIVAARELLLSKKKEKNIRIGEL